MRRLENQCDNEKALEPLESEDCIYCSEGLEPDSDCLDKYSHLRVVCTPCLDKAVAKRTEELQGGLKNNWKKSKYLGFDQNVLVSSAELHLDDGATISLYKKFYFFEMKLRVEGDNPSEVNISPLTKRIFKRLDEARGLIDGVGALNGVESVIVFINGIIDGCASLEKEATDD